LLLFLDGLESELQTLLAIVRKLKREVARGLTS
jgi:hypothetical protein